MESDKQIYKVFTVAPGALYMLLAQRAPGRVTARSEVYKALETSTDLTLEPDDISEPLMIAEFQGYLDESFIAKVMLRCALLRLKHPGRAVRCHVIYLRREFEWPTPDDDGMFQPRVHYLPDLVRQLEATDPDSPLVSVLRPLVVDDPRELTSAAAADYHRISGSPVLTPEQREVWLQVFYVWLMIRFENSLEELSKMVIAGLPPVEETPWGRELKERWTVEACKEARKEGRDEGRDEGRAEEIERQLRKFAELRAAGELPESAYHRLREFAEQELLEIRAKPKANGDS
jgi:predicted transposase YdaD